MKFGLCPVQGGAQQIAPLLVACSVQDQLLGWNNGGSVKNLSKSVGIDLPKFRRKSLQRGAALVEFALVVPLLVLMIVGVVDLGGALNSYMVLAQIAGEGVRSAGERAGLERGSNFVNLVDGEFYPGQYSVQFKVNSMLRLQDLPLSGLTVRSAYYRNGGAGNPERTVAVSISGTYNGILPVFRNFPINIEKQGPYLF